MPRASRRRRRAARRDVGRLVALWVAVALGVVFVGGSLLQIGPQSAGYRTMIDAGWSTMAGRVVDDSTATGHRLATLLADAPSFVNTESPVPRSARVELQQGLDQAVQESTTEAARLAALGPPQPTGEVAVRLEAVLDRRAAATRALRRTVDGLLGMAPLPVEGSPGPAPATTTSGALLPVGTAASALTAVGTSLAGADVAYRTLRRSDRSFHLPRSAWVVGPVATAPLGPPSLDAMASSLASTPAYQPVHRLLVTSMGLVPSAVTVGAPGLVATGCAAASPAVATVGGTPTVLPPTTTVAAELTVTDCGTVPEVGVGVTATLTLDDPAGTPSTGRVATGGHWRTTCSVGAGASVALATPGLPVTTGHRYLLTVTVGAPGDQPPGSPGLTEQFLLSLAG